MDPRARLTDLGHIALPGKGGSGALFLILETDLLKLGIWETLHEGHPRMTLSFSD